MSIPQKDISLSINFAEANDKIFNKKRLFRDYEERRFMVGFCPQKSKQWIKLNNLYPVRPISANRSGGVDTDDQHSYAVDYVILYTNWESGNYKIFPVEKAELLSIEEMNNLGYPCPQHEYLVFHLQKEVAFEEIDFKSLISQEQKSGSFSPFIVTGRSIFSCYRKHQLKKVGLVDADLLDNGTRHPNLALLKIAGFLYDNNISFELIIDPDADISQYSHIFMSRVFTFTKEPPLYVNASKSEKRKFHLGGTGYYANEKSVSKFRELREEDMNRLENDDFLNKLICKHSGKAGINMATQMPYYHLYDEYIQKKVDEGFKRDKYKDYLYYSIGFLTRKCYRHCPFCVNKLEDGVVPYSKLEWFYDKTRPHVYFWDDNFLAAPYEVWKPQLQYLIDHKISFQFRQGLDERQLAESPHGEEMAEMLGKSRYHGDFIFAFDNWKDRDLIERALKIWKRHNPKKGTKFYLFTGFMQSPENLDKFYRDIWELFQRIKILMSYGCVGYVMRHEDYHKAPIENIYVQIARWCNQQAFYKKMSFWEFCYRNQSYWEEHTINVTDRPQLKSFEEFEEDLNNGYYGEGEGQTKMCLPLKSVMRTLEIFPEHREELLEMFNYKMINLINPRLWEEK